MPMLSLEDGVRLFYREWGSGPPVVCCAGWTLSSLMWEPVVRELVSAGRRVVAVDRRGHGRSDDPGCGYDYDTLADDLTALLDHLDVSDVVLVGHSMALGELVRYTTRHGAGRLAGLVFVAPAPLVGPGPEIARTVQAAWDADLGGWARRIADDYFAVSAGNRVSDDAVEATIADMCSASRQAAVGCNMAMMSADWRLAVADLRPPATFVHGDHDTSVPPALSSEPAASLAPDARLVIVRDAGHGLYLTHAARLATEIVSS